MKKEEFPTFLNEQPTVIFGRTARELIIIAIGCSFAFEAFSKLSHLLMIPGIAGTALKLVVVALVIGASVVVALVSIAGRPLEEWCFVLLFYLLLPKVYLYMPQAESEQLSRDEEDELIQYQFDSQHADDDDDE